MNANNGCSVISNEYVAFRRLGAWELSDFGGTGVQLFLQLVAACIVCYYLTVMKKIVRITGIEAQNVFLVKELIE